MASRKKYTISDIARELNTTSSTISRALQDSPRISLKMRKAAQELARLHNYEPDFRASSLRKGNSKIIGILVPKIDRHFFATVLSGIDEVAAPSGYSVLICQSFESFEKEQQLVKNLMHGRVDGIISSISIETTDYSHFEQVISKGLPLVFFDRVCEPLRASKVMIDDYQGACMALEHLIENGCRDIAHFSGPQHINIYRDRTRGYFDTLNKYGLVANDQLIFKEAITRDAGCEAMKQMLRMKELPDAVFSSGDYSALGAILCAKEAGIIIPDEMAFTGFANEPWDSFFDPPLTSVDQHAFEIGKQAATLLLQQIESTDSIFVPRTLVLSPELIIRKSSIRKVLT
jgi:LacI family transcriptional regulator